MECNPIFDIAYLHGMHWNATPGCAKICENGETKAHDVDEICLKHMAHLWHHSKNTSWLGYHGIEQRDFTVHCICTRSRIPVMIGFLVTRMLAIFTDPKSPRMLQVWDCRDNGCASRFSFGGFLAANGPTVSTSELVSF